jgi:hypothetical protein
MRRWLDHRRSGAENFEYYELVSDVIESNSTTKTMAMLARSRLSLVARRF